MMFWYELLVSADINKLCYFRTVSLHSNAFIIKKNANFEFLGSLLIAVICILH